MLLDCDGPISFTYTVFFLQERTQIVGTEEKLSNMFGIKYGKY